MISFVSLPSLILRAAHHNRLSLQNSALPTVVIKINVNGGSEARNSCQISKCTNTHFATIQIMINYESCHYHCHAVMANFCVLCSWSMLVHIRVTWVLEWHLIYIFLVILTIICIIGIIPHLGYKRTVTNLYVYVPDCLCAYMCVNA